MSDVDIIYVYQIWMFMYVRCGYYLYVSDAIYVCQMWIFICIRCGCLHMSDEDSIYVYQMLILCVSEVDIYLCVSNVDDYVCHTWILFMNV